MFLINLMILPLPAFLSMLALWVSVRRLDCLPETEFASIRHELLMALINLAMVIGFMGMAIHNVPKFVELAELATSISTY